MAVRVAKDDWLDCMFYQCSRNFAYWHWSNTSEAHMKWNHHAQKDYSFAFARMEKRQVADWGERYNWGNAKDRW